MTSKEQLERDVKAYVATLEGLVSGDCEWFYNDYRISDDDRENREKYGDSYARISTYFEDVLDVEIISGLHGDYRGARVALGLGGPSFYLNTRRGCVEGYWWSDYAECHVSCAVGNLADEYFSELWEMSRGR